jgi:ABC-type spermidine/putrescine transport system permease subunit II
MPGNPGSTWPVAFQHSGPRRIMAVLISPMIVPVIISAIGLFFFYAYTI